MVFVGKEFSREFQKVQTIPKGELIKIYCVEKDSKGCNIKGYLTKEKYIMINRCAFQSIF